MRLSGILFDLDGTLADTLPVAIGAFQRIFARYLGHDYSADEIHDMFGPTEAGVLRRRIPDRDAEAMRDFLEEYRHGHAACVAPFPGIPEVLRGLRARGVPLAIVTGKGAETTAITLHELGLTDLFADVEPGSDGGGVKPEAIRAILARWRLPAARAAYVGDTPYDVRSARAAGVLAVAAAWAPSARVDLLRREQPDEMFQEVAEFAAWVARMVLGDGPSPPE